jgi:predicted RNA-binding protein with PIN domain
MGPRSLEPARRRLLDLLRHAHDLEADRVTVVFDAAHAPALAAAEEVVHGIQVRFAVGLDQADDLIELLIRQAPSPRELAVVSNDRRIQQAARRRGCTVLGCGDYLDVLDRERRPPPATRADPADKPQDQSTSEVQHWLREFADLANDPAWKIISEPVEFNEAEGEGRANRDKSEL